ncbi:hypothetical protein RhiirB3_441686 [Rhizophagus irregularis]|nr:hypothetical protein RhiirB3_441686 [Rhizophagus irregularis]
MSKLYRDILYLIIEELQYDRKSLVSCLTINKIWCEIIIPILWKNAWEDLAFDKENLLLNTIISHLSDEERNNLSQYSKISYKKPLFNYISFCKHLNLEIIENIILSHGQGQYNEIKNYILNLFINKNAEYTHLYMTNYYYEYHLIPEAEQCFSKIKFLRCDSRVKENSLAILTKMCKSIEDFELIIYKYENNFGIPKLIENQENLINVSFLHKYSPYDGLFRAFLENSLIKHANTIQYFNICGQLETQILTSFVNLKDLVLMGDWERWIFIENLSLPSLQSLYTRDINTESLKGLIENSGGKLNELNISYSVIFPDAISTKEIIQVICQNCPNLTHLEFYYKNCNVLDLEKLLIKCQYLKILGIYYIVEDEFMNWDNLFNILVTSSPLSLHKLKIIYPVNQPELKSLKLFFDNWEGRKPISLIISIKGDFIRKKQLNDLIGNYKSKGVVKDFIHYSYEYDDLIESKAKEIVKDLKTKAANIFYGFKNLFN